MSNQDWMNQQAIQGAFNQQRSYGLHTMKTAKEMRDFTASTVRQRIEALRIQLAEVPAIQQQLQDLEAFLVELTSE